MRWRTRLAVSGIFSQISEHRPVDLVDRQLAQFGIGIELERLEPLLGVLAVLPALEHLRMCAPRRLLKGRYDLENLASLLDRIDTQGSETSGRACLEAGSLDRDVICITQLNAPPPSA